MDSNSQSPNNGDPYIVLTSVSEEEEKRLLAQLPVPCSELLKRLNPPVGPNPHVIQSTSAVRIQRLEKKVQRLITQRDHWKSEFDKLSYILRLFPYTVARDTWEERKRRNEKLERLKEYDTMVPLLVSENERLKAQIQILTAINGTDDRT